MNITFIGGGNMARALIGGLVARGSASNAFAVVDPSPEARSTIRGSEILLPRAPCPGKRDHRHHSLTRQFTNKFRKLCLIDYKDGMADWKFSSLLNVVFHELISPS